MKKGIKVLRVVIAVVLASIALPACESYSCEDLYRDQAEALQEGDFGSFEELRSKALDMQCTNEL